MNWKNKKYWMKGLLLIKPNKLVIAFSLRSIKDIFVYLTNLSWLSLISHWNANACNDDERYVNGMYNVNIISASIIQYFVAETFAYFVIKTRVSFRICLFWGFQNCPWKLNLSKIWLTLHRVFWSFRHKLYNSNKKDFLVHFLGQGH